MLRKVSVTLEACEMKLNVLACLALFAILVSSPWVLARRAELLQDRETPSDSAEAPGFGFSNFDIPAEVLASGAQAAAEAPGMAAVGAPAGSLAPAPAPGPAALLDAMRPFRVSGAAAAPPTEPYLSFKGPPSSYGKAEYPFSPGLSSAEQQRFSNEGSRGSPVFGLASTDSNTWVEVNYTQLVANAQRLLPQVKPGTIPMAMVKGGGYGHGVVTAAKAFLEGGFAEIGTGTLNEALALRAAGVSAPVHLCYQPDIQSAPAVAHAPDVQVYVEDGAFVEALCKATTIQNRTVPIAVHVTVSTGALREGVRTEAEALALGQQIVACPGLFLRGLMTHHGDLDKFLPIISAFKETFGQGIVAHMASSTAGFFDGQQYHLDLVRLGTAMYGVRANTSAARWLTRVTGIKQAYVGDRLGYDEDPITRNMTIAVTDAGAVDGADIISQVVIRGQVCKVVGYGGMNMHMIDITSIPDAQVGDLVMMRGCCADDGTFLDVWVPSIWPNVERIAVYGAEGTFDRRQRGLNATAGSATDTLSDPPSD